MRRSLVCWSAILGLCGALAVGCSDDTTGSGVHDDIGKGPADGVMFPDTPGPNDNGGLPDVLWLLDAMGFPDGSIVLPDGAIKLPDGAIVKPDGAPVEQDGVAVDPGPSPDVETPPDCTQNPKPAGCPCTSSFDCVDYCVTGELGSSCVEGCAGTCPGGKVCLEVDLEGITAAVCLPRYAKLCQPCTEHAECGATGSSILGLCLEYGEQGSFCGGYCDEQVGCPTGYNCELQVLGDGTETTQCVKTNGFCGCNELGKDQGLTTECSKSNDFGSCTGTRFCEPSGLSPCNALEPAAEVCDELDNDCNGTVDDLPADSTCTIDNAEGSCPGTPWCDGPELKCAGDPPIPEQCNGVDDNCNGLTDEGYDDTDEDGVADCEDPDADGDGIIDTADNCPGVENPDQLDFDKDEDGDLCDPDDDNDGMLDNQDCEPKDADVFLGNDEVCDGKDNDCDEEVDEGLCDDGVLCTFDYCDLVQGDCAHAPNDALCSDGNECTTDSCDLVAGCSSSPKTGTSCDDGDSCTENDICFNGECVGNATAGCCSNDLACDDGDPCTTDVCNLDNGSCVHLDLGDGTPCNADDDGCTEGDTCQGGVCIPGPEPQCQGIGNPCVAARCDNLGPDAFVCVLENLDETTVCDDGFFCTIGDHCNAQGACVGGGPNDCGAGPGGCKTALCNEETDACEVTNLDDGTVCDDGDDCTQGDTCQLGNCVPGPTPDCSASADACNLGVCVGLGDGFWQCQKSPIPAGVDCDDGDFCTTGSTCDGQGSCLGGTMRDCQAEIGDDCNSAYCDPFLEACIPEPALDNTPCDDSDVCTLVDKCINGICIGTGDACVEERISVGPTGAVQPTVVSLGYGRYATQWWNASPGQRVRLSDAYGSRENEEMNVTTGNRPSGWTARMDVQPEGSFSVVDWSGAVEAGCSPCCSCSDSNTAYVRGTEYDYLGAQSAQNASLWPMSQTATTSPCYCNYRYTRVDSARTIPLANPGGTFGFVQSTTGSNTSGSASWDPPLTEITYYPPTGQMTVGARVQLVPASNTTGTRFDARQTIDGLNKFLLAWVDETGTRVLARRFNPNGTPDGGATAWTVVDAGAGNTVYQVRIAGFSDSKFIVLWDVANVDSSGRGVYAQRFNYDGTPSGTTFVVNQNKPSDQRLGEIGVFSDNGFVIVYDDQVGDNDGFAVMAKRYQPNGSQDGTAMVVNTLTLGDQYKPTVGVLEADEWVVVFSDSNNVVWTRRFFKNGLSSMGNVERAANATTTADQRNPVAAKADNANVLIAFESPVSGKEISEVLAVVLDNQGDVVKSEFQLNTWDKQAQVKPAVAGGPDRFVAAWESVDQDGSAEGLYAQLMYSDGTLLGDEFLVNETTDDVQRHASIGMNASGDFMVAWNGAASTAGSISEVYGKVYDKDGNVVKDEFVLNQYLPLPQDFPAVATSPTTGDFVVAWQSLDQEGPGSGGYGIFLRKFDSLGNVIGGTEVQVNTIPDADQTQAALAVSPDGQFITVCWESFDQDAISSWGVYCQLLDYADLAKGGGEYRAAALANGDQRNPVVTYLPNGQALIGWDSAGVDSDGLAVQYRRFTGPGQPVGARVTGNRHWTGDQSRIFLVPLGGSSIIVGWQSGGQDGDGLGVFYRSMPAY